MHKPLVTQKLDRIIDSIEGQAEGPTLIAIGGIHGNESAGVKALERITEKVRKNHAHFRGRFLALRGNLAALQQQVRFIDEDMNRIWFPEIINKIRKTPKQKLVSSERREIKDLLAKIDAFIAQHPKNTEHPIIIADLHSFSSHGSMFAITRDSPKNTALFSQLKIPLVVGIERAVQGAAFSFYQDLKYTTFVFEGGPHDADITVKNISAVMALTLEKTGCLIDTPLPGFETAAAYLAEQNQKNPHLVRVVYKHPIKPDNQFVMRPGYHNLQPIKKGECLAKDQQGSIKSPENGFILMPLYQKQGNDGFFIVKEMETYR